MKTKLITKIFFGGKARIGLYRKISALTQNGVKITEALESMNYRFEDMNSPLAHLLTLILKRFETGISFSQAISEYIPPEEALLIQAAELDGRLYSGLDMSCDLIENKGKITSSLIKCLSVSCASWRLVLRHYDDSLSESFTTNSNGSSRLKNGLEC